jgi:peptidoglycan/xylan/chitin deacetylase (PgdA/CDA1 family)
MLDAGEIREMVAGGITIGAHTMTHPLLPALAPAEAEGEIRASRERLEAITGGPIVHFAYPNPGGGVHHDATVRELVRRCGFRTASTSRGGIVDGAADLFALPRFGVNAGYSERSLFHALGERS